MSGGNVAVIPARGGSKRIPGKNIRSFCGQPVIAYSIRAAQQSDMFDRIVVSTDCERTAGVARDYGAETPFMRPAGLADDFTPTIPVVRHAIQALRNGGATVHNVCCIYATAPFVTAGDLCRGFDFLVADEAAEFAFPVTTYAFPILRSLKISEGRVEMFFPEYQQARSQDLPEAWHDAGQFYWGRAAAWENCEGIYSSHAVGIPLPRHRVQDIDTEEDWKRAEALFQLPSQLRD